MIDPLPKVLRAADFAAHKHRDQRRKGAGASPYINHPIQVAELLARIGGVREADVLCAALLHDTLEDTETSGSEIAARFGPTVRSLVEEMTDDKSLDKQVRKRLQIEHAASLSPEAKLVKLADKICNVVDVTHDPPKGWSHERRSKYLDWAAAVVDGLRGASPPLEAEFDRVLAEGRAHLAEEADTRG